jgi:versiconal hemiacetal acetate esterase
MVNRVSNQYDEYAKLPHYFFAFPSPHLEALKEDYYTKTIKGIEWIIQA